MTRFSSVRAISGDRMYLATIECDECSGSYPTSTNVVSGYDRKRTTRRARSGPAHRMADYEDCLDTVKSTIDLDQREDGTVIVNVCRAGHFRATKQDCEDLFEALTWAHDVIEGHVQPAGRTP